MPGFLPPTTSFLKGLDETFYGPVKGFFDIVRKETGRKLAH